MIQQSAISISVVGNAQCQVQVGTTTHHKNLQHSRPEDMLPTCIPNKSVHIKQSKNNKPRANEVTVKLQIQQRNSQNTEP